MWVNRSGEARHRNERIIEEIYEACMEALKKCNVLQIVLDGVMVDDGSAFELGIAHMRKIPKYGYLTDERKRPETPGINPMICISLDGLFTDLSSLAEWSEKFKL